MLARLETAEHFGHQRRELAPTIEEFGGQAGRIEHFAHVRFITEPFGQQRVTDRRTEQDVFGNRGVGEIAIAVERLDDDTEAGDDYAFAQPMASGQHLIDQMRMPLINCATQTVGIHVVDHSDHT